MIIKLDLPSSSSDVSSKKEFKLSEHWLFGKDISKIYNLFSVKLKLLQFTWHNRPSQSQKYF